MKLGVDSYTLRNSGLDPVGILRLARQLDLDGVLFELSPFASLRDRDLEQIRATAEELGLYLEFGMGSIFHGHPMAEKGRRLLAEAGHAPATSETQTVIQHLEVARKLGSGILRCVAGDLFTRDAGHDMAQLADDAVAILREACQAAAAMGLKIAIENHADFTVRELASILARVHSPAFGFTVDTGNLAFDLDEPLRLTQMMAPYALTTHFKNYRVIRTPQGLALENCAVGDGDLDQVTIAEILAPYHPEMHLNIEIHSQFAPFPLDILKPSYWHRHPAPPGDGLSWYLAKSWPRNDPPQPPANLADGPESWPIERAHLESSIRWARQRLGHLLH